MPSVSDWPKEERPREILIANGAAALTDTQLVALVLMTGQKGRHVMEIARELLETHGPLRKLLDMSARDMSKLPGLGMAKACMLVASLELARRHLSAKLAQGELLTDPLAARQYFKQHLRSRPVEVFAALFLDNRHRMLAFQELSTGTLNSASVYPREVARHALLHNAAAVIVGHNHPSGHAEPSAADRQITVELQAALQLVGVRLLDHIVVGEGEPVSMAERGWLGRV